MFFVFTYAKSMFSHDAAHLAVGGQCHHCKIILKEKLQKQNFELNKTLLSWYATKVSTCYIWLFEIILWFGKADLSTDF